MCNIIYLFNHEENKYIGSTTNYKVRMHAHNQHKKQKRHNKTKFYKYLNQNKITDIRPYVSILANIKEIQYDNETLRNIEQSFLEELTPNLNSNKAMSS